MTDTVTTWGTTLQAAGCPKCGHTYLVPQNRINDTCPNCFAGQTFASRRAASTRTARTRCAVQRLFNTS
ncbi:MAG: hypothetical protein HZC38_02930 [Chloroflexi bacterium]|nr:hypothetical protein [Chloroflexota bacterium]